MNYIHLQNKAKKLRKSGKSLADIGRILGVAKSSVSIWCRDIKLADSQIKKLKNNNRGSALGALANKIKREKEICSIKTLAKKQIEILDSNDLKRLRDIGTVLYWAEGTKKHVVDITNSDPQIIKIAMLWFRKICKVDEKKFHISIYYHSGQKEEEIKNYWSNVTRVPLNQFYKSIFKKEGTGQRKNVLYYGTCKIRINDCDLLHRILAWIEQLHLQN